MKRIIFLFILLGSMLSIKAQNRVGIGTTSPDESAILDITSIADGLLIPRMTYLQRVDVDNPAQGLMVYQTNASGSNQSGFYIFDGSNWKRLARADEIGGGGNNGWTISGDNQYSNLAGNVGVGTLTPTSKFHLVGNMLQESGSITMNNATAILQMQSAGVNKGYMQLSGNNVRIGTNSGNTTGQFIVRMNSIARMTVDSNGYVGIGTSGPDDKLHLYDGNMLIEHPGAGPFGPYAALLKFELSAEDEKRGGLWFTNGSTTQGAIQYNVETTGPDYMNLSMTGSSNRDLMITDQSRVGINQNATAYPLHGQLHIRNDNNVDALVLHSATSASSSTIQFYNTNGIGNTDTKKTFIQLQDSDNLRMGTNSGNTTGKIIFRMNEVDQGGMAPNGYLGLGNINAFARLHVTNGQDADPNPGIGNGYLCLGEINGTNITIDNNEMMARDFTNTAPLLLQNDGGELKVGSNNRLFVDNSGNVGFGTGAPTSRIHIPSGNPASLTTHGYTQFGPTTGANVVFDNNEIQGRSNGSAGTLFLQRSGGALDISGHTTLHGNAEVLKLEGSNPNIGFYNGPNHSFISATGNKLWMGVNGGPLHLDGTQIAIGTINGNASDYKLTVSGRIICTELKVQDFDDWSWPDYVFKEDYELKPIHELKAFISENHHLPNIPKASVVAKEGIEVGDMNRRLLEKVEELTLYVIQLQEQIDELKKKQ